MSTSSTGDATTGPSGGGRRRPSGGGARARRSSHAADAPAETPTASRPAYARIHPGIGFARVGNSPDQYLLAPEVPGRPVDAGGRYKDRQGRIKRQAQRFRVYAFDADDRPVGELTVADAEITWTVHLANRKAAWHQFRGAAAEARADAGGTALPLRNPDVADRSRLTIDPGPRSVSGAGRSGVAFDTGTFLDEPVALGELGTDEAGRLLVLGGAGRAASVDGSRVTDYANNDGWFDDTSDGPVTATVRLADGTELPVRGTAWVVVAPPDYAPGVDSVVTLHDVQTAAARERGWLEAPADVSFTRDVFPVLARIVGYRWVNDLARRGHGRGARGDFLDPAVLRRLSRATAAEAPLRKQVFARLRNPSLTGADAARQANLTFMPQLSGDEGFTTTGEPATWFSVLPHQYEIMRRWADGDFTPDWRGVPEVPQALAQLPLAEQPAALDRAAGDACVGGPFFPGIEMTYTSRDPALYAEPYRLRDDLEPGDVTKRMALPWQADFYECRSRWWPAQRPDDVVTRAEYDAVLAAFTAADESGEPRPVMEDLRLSTERWDRGLGEDPYVDDPAAGDNDMVRAWSELGVIRPRTLPNGETVLVEGERRAYYGMRDREYFHIMLNIESYPDFLPKARELAERFLGDARALQASAGCPDNLLPFRYSARVFRSRLEQIYTEAAQSADAFSLATAELGTREAFVDRLVQMAPFNQVDGAWLRNVGRVGPIDEVHALLFRVWMDELGDGDPKLNHSNVYTDLLHSVGVYLEPVSSRAYVENDAIVDSAFTSPLFQLAVAEFSEDYLPEILGMTLYLEWAVVAVKPQVEIMKALGIDPLFYSLHIGIDNAATGHGAMAKRAVELYLDEVRASAGDRTMQQTWARIWDGYVAFATTGGLGEDFRRRTRKRPNPGQRVFALIESKAHFAAQNHGTKAIGDNLINNWFADPAGFMNELVRSRWIVPGDVETSPFFDLLRPSGPMFRVFTDDEVRAWEDWTRSLTDADTPSEPDTDAGRLMLRMVQTLAARQKGTPGHAASTLTGVAAGSPDPVTRPVAWWFEQEPVALLTALADPANGWVVPGDPASSRFLTDLATGDRPMAAVLGEVAPGTAHRTWRSVAVEWVRAGCPVPSAVPLPAPPAAAPVPADPTPAPGLLSATVDAPASARPKAADGSGAQPVAVAAAPPSTRVPQLGLFQSETWDPDYDEVPVLGNGALH